MPNLFNKTFGGTDDMKLETWAGRSNFEYEGSVQTGTRINFGVNQIVNVSSDDYSRLLNHFKGRTAPIGTSRTTPPKENVGEWLQNNITKVAIASYVGAILINEGYAVKGKGSEIEFF